MTEKRNLQVVKEKGVVMLDGALGSRFMEMGLPPGKLPDEWNLLEPGKVRELHRHYIDAGSSIIVTNTFGSNPIKLSKSGLADRMHELNLAGAQHARAASGGKALVAGDIGPTGELIQPYGVRAPSDVKRGFAEQVSALCEGGVDLIMIETMYDLREALLALEASLETSPLSVCVSLTFEKKTTGFATIMGDRVEPSFSALQRAGASAVGANCSIGSAEMVELAKEMVDSTSLPIIAQPNAGKPSVVGGRISYEADVEVFAADVMRIVELGARLVGGCCGTNPSFMRVIRKKLDERQRSGYPS